jgi:outer membrane protein assembly factor BamA
MQAGPRVSGSCGAGASACQFDGTARLPPQVPSFLARRGRHFSLPRFRLFLICFLLVTTLAAQTTSRTHKKPAPAETTNDSPLSLPILKLTVEGNKNLSTAAILKASGIKLGDIAGKDAFEAARQKLADSGFFDAVGYEYAPVAGDHPGYAAKFTVTEVTPLYKIQFAGFTAKNEELEAYLKSKDPFYSGVAPPTKPLIDRWAEYLNAFTASENKPPKIVGKLVAIGADDYVIQFQPDAPLPAVARVEFTGNEAIDEATLQNTIGAVAYGLPYTEQNFRDLLDNQLRPLYEARGILRAKFEDITTEVAPLPTKGLIVHLKVVEGPVFKLGRVFITGASRDDQLVLLRTSGLKIGETVNFDTVKEGADKITHAVKRSGFTHATTDVDRKIDDANKKVDVTYKIDRGPKFEFAELTIKGLDIEGENAVRKMWGEKPGDAFNSEYPEHFLTEVRNQNLFEHLGDTKSEVKLDEQTHKAAVTLIFGAEKKDEEKERKKKRPF